jgi:uncharacterized membrane protein YagU involved in acid resistance
VYHIATGRKPTQQGGVRLGTAAHYAFSGVVGVGYALVAPRAHIITLGYGTLYGTLVWIAADETAMPALGLSRPSGQLGPGVHAYALTGHWIFGASLELFRRLFAKPSDHRALHALSSH